MTYQTIIFLQTPQSLSEMFQYQNEMFFFDSDSYWVNKNIISTGNIAQNKDMK